MSNHKKRAYLAIKYHSNQQNRPLIEAISAALAGQGIEVWCIVRDVEQWGAVHLSATLLMQKTFELLESCDFVLVDLTEKGVGLGIEAGYAFAKNKPIFTIAPAGADVSETLQGISTQLFRYHSQTELTDVACQLAQATF